MAKILIHSNAPWVPTGYGQQCASAALGFRELGHEVAVCGFSGLSGTSLNWNGIPVFPNGQEAFGWDVLAGHAITFGADLVIVLSDFWTCNPQMFAAVPCPVACWIPVDTDRLGIPDGTLLAASGVRPVAMSRHGERVLREAGFSPLYVPHSFDREAFHPAGRQKARERLSVPDNEFAVGIAAANKDVVRKAFPEQFLAFARFHEKHPDSRLYIHSMIQGRGGWDLDMVRDACDLPEEAVIFNGQYEQISGLVTPAMLGTWHRSHDVTLHASYGEGFGLTAIESQACGTPVITTRASAMTELAAPRSWTVSGQPVLNPVHYRWWVHPSVDQLTMALEKAYAAWKTPAYQKRRDAVAEFVSPYESGTVLREHWKPVLDQLLEASA